MRDLSPELHMSCRWASLSNPDNISQAQTRRSCRNFFSRLHPFKANSPVGFSDMPPILSRRAGPASAWQDAGLRLELSAYLAAVGHFGLYPVLSAQSFGQVEHSDSIILSVEINRRDAISLAALLRLAIPLDRHYLKHHNINNMPVAFQEELRQFALWSC